MVDHGLRINEGTIDLHWQHQRYFSLDPGRLIVVVIGGTSNYPRANSILTSSERIAKPS
jgi:hypothetical protein